MGYRASIITQHREYGDEIFYDFVSFEEYFYKLQELYPDGLMRHLSSNVMVVTIQMKP